jgi:hypothetical protein
LAEQDEAADLTPVTCRQDAALTFHKISLVLPNRSRIIGLPGNEATIRGFSDVSMLLIDEAAQVREEVYDTTTPMLAASAGDLWLMSTPNGKTGFFWEEWSRGGAMWTRVRVPATECPRIPKWFLDEERRRKAERVFLQEYMCVFGDHVRVQRGPDSAGDSAGCQAVVRVRRAMRSGR